MTRFMNGEEVKIEEKLMTQSSKKVVTWRRGGVEKSGKTADASYG